MGILARTPSIFARRLKRDGLRTTLLWLYGRGIPALTGAPMVKYSLVAPGVLVGPQHRQAGLRRLAAMGVRYCVNMRTEFDDAEHGLAPEHYCHLPTVDDEAPTLEQLRRGVEFVEQAVSAGESVYIHCGGGIGRAPTMAAAYFISRGYTLDEAIALIRETRPFIHIMPPQLDQLRRFEASIRGESGDGALQSTARENGHVVERA